MNVHLSIVTVSLALATTTSSFFGMNLLSGLEQVPGLFPLVVAGSCTTGAVVALSALHYMRGHTMQKRAAQRIQEIDTLNSALSDMSALDYTLKNSVGKGVSVSKAEFRRRLRKARQSRYVSDHEVDLLFDVFDKVKDGLLTLEEYNPDKAARRDREKDWQPVEVPPKGPA